MDRKHRLTIEQNMDFIAKNICYLPHLLNLLLEKSVLTQLEVEKIRSIRTHYEAGTELANLVCKKDTSKFPVFISCLCESGHDVIAKRLESTRHLVFWSYILPIVALSALAILLVAILLQNMDRIISADNLQDKIDNIVQTNEPHYQQIWFGVTSPNRFYVGREKEMEILERYWNNSIAQKTLSIVAVTGLGGVGKSELAKNFAKVVYEKFKGHCIWIDAENNQSMEKSFKNLAQTMEISLKNHFGQERSFLEIVGEVYEKLFGQNVLLLFDNVENYEIPVLKMLIDLSLKKPPTVLKPFVITTSRLISAKKYFGILCSHLDLQVLPKHSAIQFFLKSLSTHEHSENITELIEILCQRLQFFPLAMQQASAYINERTPYYGNLQEAIKSYLTQMNETSKNLLNYNLPQYESLESISKTTFLTWRMTLNQITSVDGGEVAMDIMIIISFLSPDSIPTQIIINIFKFLRGGLPNVSNVDYIFERLRKYSMISYKGENLITVHRLVQEVTRIELAERGEYRNDLQKIAQIMMNMLRANEISLKHLVHVQTVWNYLSKEKELIEMLGSQLWWICQKLYDSGKYRDLLLYSSELGDLLYSVLGDKFRWTLQMRYWKGKALKELAEYLESLELLKDVYEKQKEIFGDEDIDCIRTANQLGIAYANLDLHEDAMKTYKKTLEISERSLGKKSRLTLSLKGNIASLLSAQEKLDEALKLHKEVLKMQKRLFGVEDYDTLTTKHNIACVKLKQKDYQEALTDFIEVLKIRERVLELNHTDTLQTKYFIAYMYHHHHLGIYEEGLQYIKTVYENEVQILGQGHPFTISTEKVLLMFLVQPYAVLLMVMLLLLLCFLFCLLYIAYVMLWKPVWSYVERNIFT